MAAKVFLKFSSSPRSLTFLYEKRTGKSGRMRMGDAEIKFKRRSSLPTAPSPRLSFPLSLSLPLLLSELIKPTLFWFLFRSPPQELSAVTETAAGKVIVTHLSNKLCLQRLPFAGLLCAPATWPAGLVSSKARRLDQRSQKLRQFFLLRFIETRSKTYVMK